jgi:hypothetical protein
MEYAQEELFQYIVDLGKRGVCSIGHS